jgi:hypothetical protein
MSSFELTVIEVCYFPTILGDLLGQVTRVTLGVSEVKCFHGAVPKKFTLRTRVTPWRLKACRLASSKVLAVIL